MRVDAAQRLADLGREALRASAERPAPGSTSFRFFASRSAFAKSTCETDSALRMRRCSTYCLPSARHSDWNAASSHGRRRVAPLERVADDAVRLEERPQDAVRVERPQRAQQGARSRPRPRRAAPPTAASCSASSWRISPRNSVLLREEELELEEVAQPHRLVPELAAPVGDAVLGGAQQRELGDRAVHEEVDDGVAVVRGGEVLVRARSS